MKKEKEIVVVSFFLLILFFMVCGCVNQNPPVTPVVSPAPMGQDRNITIPPTSPSTPVTSQPPATDIPISHRPIDVVVPGSFLARGDKLPIRGTLAGGNIPVRIWLIANNYSTILDTNTASDGSFSYTISQGFSFDLPPGPLFVIVQAPGPDKRFDINYNSKSGMVSKIDNQSPDGTRFLIGLDVWRASSGSIAGNGMIDVFQNHLDPADDLYDYFITDVEKGYILIDPTPVQTRGDRTSITGTTNLQVGDEILVEVYQQSGMYEYSIPEKSGKYKGATGTVRVHQGNDLYNTWEYSFDSSGWNPDSYWVQASGITDIAQTSGTFELQ